MQPFSHKATEYTKQKVYGRVWVCTYASCVCVCVCVCVCGYSTLRRCVDSAPSLSLSDWALTSMTLACRSSPCRSSTRCAKAASLLAVSCSRLSSRLSPSAAARFWLLSESVRAWGEEQTLLQPRYSSPQAQQSLQLHPSYTAPAQPRSHVPGFITHKPQGLCL